jgi:glucose-6-phosphate dehydrogenase assembly protein OpcA
MDGASDRYIDGFEPETAINLETIEEQIAQLWNPQTRGDDPIASLATRAAVLNLIIYAPDSETADEVQTCSERLSQIHPCRVILFSRINERSPDPLVPDIFATCDADSDDPEIPCIERIRVPVNQTLYNKLASLTQPLIIPELPAFLWWREHPSVSDSAFIALAQSADLTIIDSQQFDSVTYLGDLIELDTQLPARSAIVDLNWQRLQPWRELTAQFFDIRSVNWALSWIREIEIDAGKQDGSEVPVQAIMLTSWLAHCLGWTPFEARRTRGDRWYIGMHDRFGSQIRIIIRTRPGGKEWSGHLLAMSMTARNDEGDSTSLSLSRSRGSSLIRMSARSGTEQVLHHAAHHPRLADEALLMPILESASRDPMYDASLEKVVEIMDVFGNPEVK